jgi:hypothetical protein
MTMSESKTTVLEGMTVHSSIGNRQVDYGGSAVSGSRMEASKAYAGIPVLLQKVINEENAAAAWAGIVTRIDYIHLHVASSLKALDVETGFSREVRSEVQSGKVLLFKPNLVGPQVIHPDTHGEDLGAPVCTDWSVIAALMRWFHDNLGITYHQMALGEASTSVFICANIFSRKAGREVTPEAVFEGKCGDFYGGWAFYFVRKYLAHHHPSDHTDDPMKGYEESVSGTYLPPGKARDRLMVYDLNTIGDDLSRGRTIPVPGGANFREVTLHKAIIGGNPLDTKDLEEYPGCVLINVPKLKIHAQDLITNAIKNLGIGLYPVRCPERSVNGHTTYKYSLPSSDLPSFKAKLPHMPWVVEIDEKTHLPLKDKNGEYLATRTDGMPGTQSDVIRATQDQGVYIVHVSDSIDMINLNHNPEGIAVRIPEGYIFSSLDCVALDLMTARYCFKTVPMAEGLRLKEQNGWNTEFVHHVPVAEPEGKDIVTREGLDSPLFRYNLYSYAEKRGVGKQQYYVTGWDRVTGTPLASLSGHLGRIEGQKFVELMTGTMYYNPSCMLWDMQRTILSYAEAHDRLTGSTLLNDLMDAFDENKDGVIDYDENGRKGYWSPGFGILSSALHTQLTEEYGAFKGHFYQQANFLLKNSFSHWNAHGHDFTYEYLLVITATLAYNLSQSESMNKDDFVPGMSWGRGKWPSWQHALRMGFMGIVYGGTSLEQAGLSSLYGDAFQYADKTLNNGGYTGNIDQMVTDPGAMAAYFKALKNGGAPLDFTLYVPEGFGNFGREKVPNVVETSDPARIFTAHFKGGREVW